MFQLAVNGIIPIGELGLDGSIMMRGAFHHGTFVISGVSLDVTGHFAKLTFQFLRSRTARYRTDSR